MATSIPKENEHSANIASMFSSFQNFMNAEQQKREEIKDKVGELEQTTREILAISQRVHQSSSDDGLRNICEKMQEKFIIAKAKLKEIDEKVPLGQYYRYNDHWRMTMQRLVFLCSLKIYLEENKFATKEEIADILGVKLEWKDGLFLDLEDYLIGLLVFANELSRLAVNCVTIGNYKRPQSIAAFLSELDAAFRLLNLKNDFLRRKFDGLKYDLKKVEEVVYDLSIRGLNNINTSE